MEDKTADDRYNAFLLKHIPKGLWHPNFHTLSLQGSVEIVKRYCNAK